MQRDLNERQQAVLDWISNGCPDGTWNDTTYKVSAQALQNRGLVKITKRRGYWTAELTNKGRQCSGAENSSPAEASSLTPEAPSAGARKPRPRTTPKTHAIYADQLLEELAANNGCLIKPIGTGPHAVNWVSRVNITRKSGKIPNTQELCGYHTHQGYEIKLVDLPTWRLAELAPLPVPTRLTRPHAMVAALQKQPQPMGLTKTVQGRALRIIQSLITAAQEQGHVAALGPTQGAPPPHRRRRVEPHFTITAQGETVGFLVLQEQDRSEHIPTDTELADAKKHTWMRIPRFDYTLSDRLRFILRGGNPHRATEWADNATRPLEDQLAEIAQEITLRGEAAVRRRRADQLAAEERRRRWEAAMQEARTACAHAYRVKHLDEQAEAWHRATRLAEYMAAVRSHAAALPPGEKKAEIEEWLAFASTHLQRLTETASAPKLPTPPKPGAADLEPFLHGWSPYPPRSY
ncbi:hypothetical protein [Streptomyces sp. NPDC005408]|uniref:hypothetical protein n=1 Tax=Streptomyces sp. NPDC005408 TaxID=3155341 RepID=UPI0033BB7D5D